MNEKRNGFLDRLAVFVLCVWAIWMGVISLGWRPGEALLHETNYETSTGQAIYTYETYSKSLNYISPDCLFFNDGAKEIHMTFNGHSALYPLQADQTYRTAAGTIPIILSEFSAISVGDAASELDWICWEFEN